MTGKRFTPDETERIRRMVADGFSDSAIAAALWRLVWGGSDHRRRRGFRRPLMAGRFLTARPVSRGNATAEAAPGGGGRWVRLTEFSGDRYVGRQTWAYNPDMALVGREETA